MVKMRVRVVARRLVMLYRYNKDRSTNGVGYG